MKQSRILILTLALLALGGCSAENSQPASPSERELVILAIDHSGSTESTRMQFMDQSIELATDLDAGRTNFAVYRFATKAEEFYSGVPADEDGFILQLKNAVEGSASQKGTSYSHLIQTLGERVKDTPEDRVRVIVIGDGFDDFIGSKGYAAQYSKAANLLAGNAKVSSIVFWGVKTGAREQIRSAFKEAEGKLEVRSLDQPISR